MLIYRFRSFNILHQRSYLGRLILYYYFSSNRNVYRPNQHVFGRELFAISTNVKIYFFRKFLKSCKCGRPSNPELPLKPTLKKGSSLSMLCGSKEPWCAIMLLFSCIASQRSIRLRQSIRQPIPQPPTAVLLLSGTMRGMYPSAYAVRSPSEEMPFLR